jgi:hypothetical protein
VYQHIYDEQTHTTTDLPDAGAVAPASGIVIAGAEMPLSDLGRQLLASHTAADRAS